MDALKTINLSKRFAGGGGIESLNLDVPQGSLYGFVGPNGAGKTTTLRLILGLLKPDQGEIRLSQQSHGVAIGALIEAPSLYAHLSARDNLEITRRLLGVNSQRCKVVLDTVGLSEVAEKRVQEFSLGMKQRLGIALALLGEPRILILDEPSNGLDPAGIAELRILLRGFVENDGITVLMSSHLLGEVEQLATHVGVLVHGKLRFQGSIEAMRAQAQENLEVICDRADAALSLLQAQGHIVRQGKGNLVVEVPKSDRGFAAHINSLLVHQGFAVNHLSLQRANLEDQFFALTQTQNGPI